MSLAFLTVVLVFYLIFLIVIIKNSLIYEEMKFFIDEIIASFIIIEIFFSAGIFEGLGINSVLSYFYNL